MYLCRAVAKKLISNLLVVNRHRRYTAIDVLCDPFILTVGGSQQRSRSTDPLIQTVGGGSQSTDQLDELRVSRRLELEHRAKQNRLAFKYPATPATSRHG